MAGEEVGAENAENSFKKFDEEKQENRKTKVEGDGMIMEMCTRMENLKMFEGYRV